MPMLSFSWAESVLLASMSERYWVMFPERFKAKDKVTPAVPWCLMPIASLVEFVFAPELIVIEVVFADHVEFRGTLTVVVKLRLYADAVTFVAKVLFPYTAPRGTVMFICICAWLLMFEEPFVGVYSTVRFELTLVF